MKKRALGLSLAVAFAIGAFAAPVAAGQPTNPGCFGTDRAAWLAANSGAAWGAIAPTRAGDNGAINQAYQTTCGGDPA